MATYNQEQYLKVDPLKKKGIAGLPGGAMAEIANPHLGVPLEWQAPTGESGAVGEIANTNSGSFIGDEGQNGTASGVEAKLDRRANIISNQTAEDWLRTATGSTGSDGDTGGGTGTTDTGGSSGGGGGTTATTTQTATDTGHDGTQQGMTREEYRDRWMSSGIHDIAGLRAWLAQNGGTLLSDNGTVRTPYGETLDMLIGARTGNGQAGWTGIGGGGSGGSGGGSGGSGGGSGGGGQWNDLYQQLMARSKQGLEVSRFDPVIKSQADAYSANQTREGRKYMAARAESGNPYATGALQGEGRMMAEHVGQATGSFEAELMGREVAARRDEIQNALSQMGGMLTESQRLALQKELGYLNAEIQRQQMAQQQSQFDSQLGFNVDDRRRYWDAVNSGLITG